MKLVKQSSLVVFVCFGDVLLEEGALGRNALASGELGGERMAFNSLDGAGKIRVVKLFH